MECKIYLFLLQFIILGFRTVKAIKGTNVRQAAENEFSFIVCINRHNPNLVREANVACTGILVQNMFVLSAEQCFEDIHTQPYEITMGAYNLDMGSKFYPIWWLSFSQYTVLMGNPEPVGLNDIMLLKIFGFMWQPIVPAQLGFIAEANVFYGMNTDIVGCGRINTEQMPTVLHTGSVQIISLHDCRDRVSNMHRNFIPIMNKYYCSIGVPYTYIDNGDSGGPLLYFGLVVGINIAICPMLDGGFHNGQVNIHVNLYHYQDFINGITSTN